MIEDKNRERLTEVEFCIGRYLDDNIIKVMDDTRSFLSTKQGEEQIKFNTSFGGILSSMAMAGHPGIDTSQQILKTSGEWNKKTTEDYIVMCRERITTDNNLLHDFTALTMEWRSALIAEIGTQKYKDASEKLGVDLASAYMDYRIQQRMIDKLIHDQTPKSATDYIIRKAVSESLVGLPYMMSKSPLEAQIAKEAEEKYKANGKEWVAAKAVSFGIDTATTFGCGSWANLAKLAGAEVVFAGIEAIVEKKSDKKTTISIEECISKGIFDSKENELKKLRQESFLIDADSNENISRINSILKHPIKTEISGGLLTKATLSAMRSVVKGAKRTNDNTETDKAIATDVDAQDLKEEPNAQTEVIDNNQKADSSQSPVITKQGHPTNESGWGTLMSEMGFDGLGDIGRNLGYVIAMLPDVLVGLFTGKTQSLHLRDNLIPMASIVAGMFIKNPILKTIMIGMGGMNLLNKAGHEQLERHNQQGSHRFKIYQDEELNPRISSPKINGNCLVADIDKTPCSITLPDNVVAALQTGALPLNTLANTVLQKHDESIRMAQENYRTASEHQTQTTQISR